MRFDSIVRTLLENANQPITVKGYHGGGWSGDSLPLLRDGEFGTGVYFTSDYGVAKHYATDTEWHEIQGGKGKGKRKYIVEVEISFRNPFIVKKTNPNPFNVAQELGINPERIEKAFERKGNAGSVIRLKGQNLGYDGMILDYGDQHHYVVWSVSNVKVTNVEELS